jgi:hypothetical protein
MTVDADFEAARLAKFERGRREHGEPWNAASIDAAGEIMQECLDIANYAELLGDRELAAAAGSMARWLWRRCWELKR